MTERATPAPAVLAFDIGGTDMKVGILDGPLAAGAVEVRDLRRLATPQDGARTADAVVERVAELTAEYRASHPGVALAAVGVSVPGLVDEDSGVGIFSANLGWRDYPFHDRLSAALDVPVAFGHDVGMAGDAEYRIGAARGRSDVVVMVIGTGVAGVVICDGRRISGGGFAGEVGHALVPAPDGSLQVLESIGSAGAIARRYAEAAGAPVDGARAVLALARAGNETAARVWNEAIDALAFSIAQCASTLGTETVVLGGGLSMAGAALFDPLARRIDELLTFHRRPQLVHAQLGENAGLIGSALKARDMLARTQPVVGAA